MDNKYYAQELDKLRNLSKEFANKYPAIAERLLEPSVDPDIERLLEGVAFLGADMRQRIDQEFPSLFQNILSILCPDHLQPLPSVTMLSFKPRDELAQVEHIPSGTQVSSTTTKTNSVPICFSTCYDIYIYPLEFIGINCIEDSSEITNIKFSLRPVGDLSRLPFSKLRFYLSGDYGDASNIFYLLSSKLQKILIQTDASKQELAIDALTTKSFNQDAMLYNSKMNDIPTFNLLREYFIFPQKFMFLELDISNWVERDVDNTFSITFQVDAAKVNVIEGINVQVELNAVPAINLMTFKDYVVNHEFRHEDIMLNVVGEHGEQLDVVQVDKVVGISPDDDRENTLYKPFSVWSEQDEDPYYQVKYSYLSSRVNTLLSLAYPPSISMPLKEVLTIDLQATQGKVAQNVGLGSVTVRGSSIKETVEFTNITRPTRYISAAKNNSLPYLLSHMSFSLSNTLTVEELQSMIRHYLPNDQDEVKKQHYHKIDAIVGLQVLQEEDLFGRNIITGQQIRLEILSSAFISIGDLYVFGSVINAIMSACTALNSYTTLEIIDKHSGDTMRWPKQLGMEQKI
jgi:type VI secretion system protein ImpG